MLNLVAQLEGGPRHGDRHSIGTCLAHALRYPEGDYMRASEPLPPGPWSVTQPQFVIYQWVGNEPPHVEVSDA